MLAYGFMSLFLIRQINSKFTTIKGVDASTFLPYAVLAIPIALFMGIGWVGQSLSAYLPNDFIMYAITLLGIWYYCFMKVSFKNPRRKVEVVSIWLCYLFLIGKAALPKNVKSGLSPIVGLICVVFMSFCLWYRNYTLDGRLVTEPNSRPPLNASDICCVC
jgi:hypothetical protein